MSAAAQTTGADAIVQIRGLGKTYASGHQALKKVDLDIRRGEILALLGPNGAGKTTLIGIICGMVRASAGTVRVAGFDSVAQYRSARALVGLVPQELLRISAHRDRPFRHRDRRFRGRDRLFR